MRSTNKQDIQKNAIYPTPQNYTNIYKTYTFLGLVVLYGPLGSGAGGRSVGSCSISRRSGRMPIERPRRVGDRRYLVRLSTEDGHKAVHAMFDDCESVAREMLTGVGVGFVTFKPASAPICANYAFYQMRPPRAARCRRPHLFRGDAQTKTHLAEADRTDLLGTRVVWPVV